MKSMNSYCTLSKIISQRSPFKLLMQAKTNTTFTVAGKWLLFITCILFQYATIAQETYGIKGTIRDSSGQFVESGNIIVLSPADSSVIKGTHFWDGRFELMGLEERNVLIKATAHGYMPLIRPENLTERDSLISIDDLILYPDVQSLDEVSVVAQKPMFEREPDRLIINVEGTILAEKGTVLDLLRSAPNVIVRSNGSIEVVGKGAAIIYLDDRRLNTLELLNSIQANDVAKIEIIDNPSARYDAAGNAVIEIKTKSGAMNGYEVQLGLRGMYRTEQQVAYWSSVSIRKNWFSMYASAYQYAGTLHEDENYYREVYGSPLTTMDNSVEREIFHNFDTGYNLNMDFRVKKDNTIFVNYSGSRLKSEPFVRNTNEVYEDGVYSGLLESESNGNQTRLMNSVATGYRLNMDTLGSEFRVTGQFTGFSSDNIVDITQRSNFSTSVEQSYRNFNENRIRVYSTQSDLIKKFRNKMELSAGVKFSSVGNESFVDLRENVNGSWQTDSSTYNSFDYLENIGAAYVEFRGSIKKLHFITGLRYEGTRMTGNSFISGTGVVDRKYHNLFPSVMMNYDITKDLIVGLSYNYRIQRPLFQDMDPFVIFIDSLTAFRGNPQLLPSYTHNAEASLVYMEYASIKLGYQRSVDPMFLTVEKDLNANTFSAITKNIKSSEMYTIAVVLPWENDWWTTFNAFGYYVNDYRYENNQQIVASTEPTWYISLYNEFRIPKLFNIEINYEYYNPGAQGFFIAKPYQFLMASISRKFLDNKLAVNFSVYDPFIWSIERASSNLSNFYVDYSSWMDSRSFMLTLRYNFGKLDNKYLVGRDIDRENKNRIKN